MTNEQIIEVAKAEHGITEETHTYSMWKRLGYHVRKGEKAAFSCAVWKPGKCKVEKDGEEQEKMRMFMRKAHFFTESQVEAMA